MSTNPDHRHGHYSQVLAIKQKKMKNVRQKVSNAFSQLEFDYTLKHISRVEYLVVESSNALII